MNFRSFVIPAALFLHVAVAPPSIATGAGEGNMSKCPGEDIGVARRHFAEEQARIAKSAGKVARKGLQLELKTAGRVVVLQDDCTQGEPYVRYTFESFENGFFLISGTGLEGSGYDLVSDRTGETAKLENKPVFSPDRKRFVTMSMDLEAGFNENSIQVWRLDPSGPVLEYQIDTAPAWGPSYPAWKDNGSIAFKKNVLLQPGGKYRTTPALLVRKGDTWELQDPPR